MLRAEGIDVVEGRARLTGPRSVSVGSRRLQAGRLVLATGAAPAVPDVPGLAQVPYLTSDTVWELAEQPGSLVVLGAGPLGCELAFAFALLGTRVTLLEGLDRVLVREEPEASEVIARVLAQQGVHVRAGVAVTRVDRTAQGGVRLVLADGSAVDADRLLVTTGRRPVTDGLDLQAAGIEPDARGFVPVDARLRTAVAGVYAVGDVTGLLQLTHAADEMGRTAAVNALRRPLRLRFRADAVPWVTFTVPEVARVGMTEAQAAAHGGRVALLPMSKVDRAVTDGRTEGFIKLVAGPRRLTGNAGGGRLLGATIVADHAGEMIHEVALAIRTGMFTGRLAQTVHAYPTLSTGVRSAAAQFFVERDGVRARKAVAA
ncbi:MAG: dihydrolipoyl dehydrogenase family protein [Mycobacteriales bacterium]